MYLLGITLIFLFFFISYLVYYFFVGPSKIERDIKKSGGIHPCFYCKKEIHINEINCSFCRKPNYKALRKNRIKYFLITIFLVAVGLSRLYDKIGGSFL